MKLGIMQPYFFPYLGYFDLIHSTDRWVVFDEVQYIRHGWVNRNRILHPQRGWSYIIVPLQKHHRSTLIKDIRIAGDIDWRRRIMGQIQHYRKKAPFFDSTYALVKDCLSVDTEYLSRLNVAILEKICRFLQIDFACEYLSELNIDINTAREPDDWALSISCALGADEYINPPGGKDIFNRQKYESRGIRLTIRNPASIVYECADYSFTENLSVIDVLMWNGAEKTRSLIQSHFH